MGENKSKAKIKKRSQLSSILFRFSKNRLAVLGAIVFLLLIIISLSADLIANYEEDAITQNMKNRLMMPHKDHIFGTDQFGRDIFARIIFGARVSLSVGLATVLTSLIFGTLIGSIAGYYGGKIDDILMRIMDIFLAIPSMLLAISIVAALGSGMHNLLIALSISQIPRLARVVRSSIISVKDQEFIEAAKACGTKSSRIIIKHIIPNAIGPIIVQATLNMASTILNIAALSFIGLGIKPPTPEWGSMLSDVNTQLIYYPYLAVIPGVAIMIAVLALNLIGDGLRDALDPKLKN